MEFILKYIFLYGSCTKTVLNVSEHLELNIATVTQQQWRTTSLSYIECLKLASCFLKVGHVCNLSTEEIESGVQGYPQLHSEVKVSPGYVTNQTWNQTIVMEHSLEGCDEESLFLALSMSGTWVIKGIEPHWELVKSFVPEKYLLNRQGFPKLCALHKQAWTSADIFFFPVCVWAAPNPLLVFKECFLSLN